MSKILALALLTVSSLLTLPPVQTSPVAKAAPFQSTDMTVTVLFSGLMVFNFNDTTKSYEVGILDHAEGHDFCVQGEGVIRQCRQKDSEKHIRNAAWLPTGKNWSLEVKSSTLPSNSTPVMKGHDGKRRPDHKDGQYDFDWIIDLDGPGFHNQPLELLGGHLKPIIQLPKVPLFTRYKSPDFIRLKGGKPDAKEFGFVAESLGMKITLKPTEYLILKDNDNPALPPIFRIDYVAPSDVVINSEALQISNTRYPATNASDFSMYYKLFTINKLPIPTSEQFDFKENLQEPRLTALNPARRPKDVSCCELVCSAIRLLNGPKALY